MVKKLTLLIISTLPCSFLSNILYAQTHLLPPNQPEQDACNAIPVCGTFYTPYSYQGTGRVLDLNRTPCDDINGGGEANVVWLKLVVTKPGKILFSINPVDAQDDYDFAVLNTTGVPCAQLSPNNVVRCNFNANVPGSSVTGAVGLSLSSTETSVAGGTFGHFFCSGIDAVAGETYLVMINNFGHDNAPGPSSGFTIDFTGTTATFAVGTSPELSNVLAPVCGNTMSVTITLKPPVLCSSIAADGSDFTVSGGATVSSASGVNCTGAQGYTNAVTLTLASPLLPGIYTINAKQGTDNNTLLGLCDNELQLPASLTFTVPPPIVTIDSQFICYSQLPYTWNGIQVAKGGNNAATFVARSSGGCDSTIILNLTVSNPPVTTNTIKLICSGDTYKLPWNDSAVNSAGIFTHTYPAVSGCDSAVSIITVRVDKPSQIIQSFICLDSSKTLSIGQGYSNYLWNNGATTPTITVNTTGTYTVKAIDSVGCGVSDTINASFDIIPRSLAKNIPLCKGTTITINATQGFISYLWNDGSTQPSLNVSDAGTYTVNIVDTNGCPGADTATVITVLPPANFLGPDTTKCFYNSISIVVNGVFNTYAWSTGATAQNIFVPVAGTYSLTVTDTNGCTGTDSIKVIDSACAQYIYLPTAFTPNGDAHNDVFKPLFAGIATTYNLVVYNRLGQKVFESNSPANGWDGTLNGQPQPTGVYVWFCRYSLAQQQPVVQKGTIILIR